MDEVAAIDVGDGTARAEIDHMGAAAERVDARFRAGMAPAEAPHAREAQLLSETEHELDDVLWITLIVAVEPEGTRPELGLNRH